MTNLYISTNKFVTVSHLMQHISHGNNCLHLCPVVNFLLKFAQLFYVYDLISLRFYTWLCHGCRAKSGLVWFGAFSVSLVLATFSQTYRIFTYIFK